MNTKKIACNWHQSDPAFPEVFAELFQSPGDIVAELSVGLRSDLVQHFLHALRVAQVQLHLPGAPGGILCETNKCNSDQISRHLQPVVAVVGVVSAAYLC